MKNILTQNVSFKDIFLKIKDNLIYIFVPIIFVSFLLINLNVVYFGDDYYYLTFSNLNFLDYFAKLTEHYYKDNGRFIIHMLATIFLKLPMPFWQILNSLILTGICYLVAKIISQKNTNSFILILTSIFFFIASLDITITRQSTYWLTGSFNYIYPIFLLFAYWYYLSKIDNSKYFTIAILLGLLASATMEQSGMMVFGLTLLSLIAKIDNIKNIKNILKKNSKLLILSAITLLGVCSVVLAPAQFVRIENEQTEISTLDKIISNSEFLIDNYTRHINILPYCIIFNLLILTYTLTNEKNNKLKFTISILCILNILLNILSIFILTDITTLNKIIIALSIILTYFISFIYINKNLYNKIFSPLTISLILMSGSQIMMLISPIFGLRNLIFGLMMFAFLICLIGHKTNFKYKNIVTVILFVLALSINIQTAHGYTKTKIIENKNIEIISNTNSDILSNTSEEITLYKFKNDNYAWSMPYVNTYHEFYFKHFYNIKCKINWVYPK